MRHRGQESVRTLLVLAFVPVVIVVGVLATAVLGHTAADRGTLAHAPPVVDRAAGRVPPSRAPAAPAVAPAAEAQPPGEGEIEPEPELGYVPAGAERVNVGSGALGAAIFRPPGSALHAGAVVVFLHGWVAIDPRRYGAWIAHLVRRGATVIYPAYQTKPAHDTATPLANAIAGVRSALDHVTVAPGQARRRRALRGRRRWRRISRPRRAERGLPAPAAVFSVYPGPQAAPSLNCRSPRSTSARSPAGTRMLAYAGERDTAVGSGTRGADRRAAAPQADAELRDHPRRRRRRPQRAARAAARRSGRSGRRWTRSSRRRRRRTPRAPTGGGAG